MSFLKPSYASTNPNNLSAYIEQKHKPKCPTFISSASRSVLRFDHIDQNTQNLKICIKKQSDRRHKLKKLLDRYQNIYTQQKKHLKQIKGFIIEMKDTSTASKLKIFIDPSILVDNQIKPQTRQFLCTLMNTFYSAYQQNEKNNQLILSLSNTMSYLIKGVSYNQDMIFIMQKTQINQQVQLEGQLLTEKNKIKEQLVKKKQINQLYESINSVYQSTKTKHEAKKKKVQELRKKAKELKQHSKSLQNKIQYQQNLKILFRQKIDAQMLFKQKITHQLSILQDQVENKSKLSKKLLKQLFYRKFESQKREETTNCAQNKTSILIGQQLKQKQKFKLQVQFSCLR